MWSENIPLPRLREFQEDVIRIERGDDEADAAEPETAAQDVVAQERERRMERDAGDRRHAAVGDHLIGGQRRVAIDRLQVMADVAVREMLQIVRELSGLAAL